MTLDDATTAFLAHLEANGRVPLHESTPAEARARGAGLTTLLGTGPEMAEVSEQRVGEIVVRILRPTADPRGIVVYYHGGGFVVGDLDGSDTMARQLASRTDCTVVMPAYRLAPEHPHPAAVDDAWGALRWVDEHHADLAREGAPLIVMGDSAGGNLAAVMTHRARFRGGPVIDHQVLVYPMTDTDFDRPSYTAPENQLMVDRDAMLWFFDHYTPDPAVRSDPEVSPLRIDDLAGLPPATIVLAGHDTLRDEGAAYAEALAAAGVPVDARTFEDQMHGFLGMVNLLPGAATGMDHLVRRLTSVLEKELDAVVIGAGFAGLAMLKRLDELGVSARVFETGDDVGGTWYWNRYPGARCDVESTFYSYGFDPQLDQEWSWSDRYASGQEIIDYLHHVVDRFGLRPSITFGTTIAEAAWDEDAGRWTVRTDRGETVRCRYLISAAGCLTAAPQVPHLPGQEEFAGTIVHTSRWPADGIDLAGKRVAVIGTGSTGIQVIPQLAQQAAHLTVLQRTAHFSAPAGNRPVTEAERAEIKGDYPAIRADMKTNAAGTGLTKADTPAGALPAEEQQRILHEKWERGGPGIIACFADVLLDEGANDVVADFFRARLAEVVEDPATAELLTPHGYPVGTKRICVDSDYYETFNRDDVSLVSIKDTPIERLTAHGIVVDGIEHPADVIVLATGYDAITGPLNAIDVRGRDGLVLREEWADGPRAYLGVTVSGFPNLFLITGPGSPSVLVNMVTAIEHHVDLIADLLSLARERGVVIDPDPGVEEEWVATVNAAASMTLYPRAGSWYMGANIPGKPRGFMPFVGGMTVYRQICEKVAAEDYAAFVGRSTNQERVGV